MRTKSLIIAVLALAAGTLHAAEAPPTGKLPRGILPLHYDLQFRVDPHAERFKGTATLKLRVVEASDHLWLHGKEFDVAKVEWKGADGKPHAGSYAAADAKSGVARVDFGARVPAGEIELRIDYSAPYNHQLEGLYRARQADQQYVVTQMEPVSARHAFPSFDEPSFKTPIDLTLEVPNDQKAVANTKLVSEKPLESGWKQLTFATTPPLPTYLVAFAVGPWDVVDGPAIPATAWRKEPIPLRGLSAKGEGERLREALASTPAIVTALEDYFGYGYAFGKLDLLAAPDFSAGAMENPGLIIFRDWALLLDRNSPTRYRRGSFNTNAHELAHQWFGDTVTMPWWDDIWLNEAFASWMQRRITQQLRPDYRADLDGIEGAAYAMRADSLASARRIRQPIGDNGDIEGAFDGITYSKGAAVLGMFEAYLGPDKFRQGIRTYVAKHAFANATAEDLVTTLAQAGDQGERFRAAMRSFLDQPGVPLLKTALDCSGPKPVLDIRQERYLPLGSKADAHEHWGVPMCLKYGVGGETKTQCTLVDTQTAQVTLDGACPDWYLPNADSRGYYRFAQTSADFAKLTARVAKLSDTDQLAYADAVSAGFQRGDIDAPALLDAMQALANAPTRQAVMFQRRRFRFLRDIVADTTQRARLDAFVARLYLPRLRELGYERTPGESEDATLFRSELVEHLALDVRNPEVRAALLKQADRVLTPGEHGHLQFKLGNADIMGDVLAVAVQERGAPVVDALIAELAKQDDPMLRSSMVGALGATYDARLAERVREYALTDAVKTGEVYHLLSMQTDQPENRAAYWAWFQRRFDDIARRTPAFAQGRVPEDVSWGWCSAQEATTLRTWFEPKVDRLIGARQGLARALETIDLCRAQREHHTLAALARWSGAQPAP